MSIGTTTNRDNCRGSLLVMQAWNGWTQAFSLGLKPKFPEPKASFGG